MVQVIEGEQNLASPRKVTNHETIANAITRARMYVESAIRARECDEGADLVLQKLLDAEAQWDCVYGATDADWRTE